MDRDHLRTVQVPTTDDGQAMKASLPDSFDKSWATSVVRNRVLVISWPKLEEIRTAVMTRKKLTRRRRRQRFILPRMPSTGEHDIRLWQMKTASAGAEGIALATPLGPELDRWKYGADEDTRVRHWCRRCHCRSGGSEHFALIFASSSTLDNPTNDDERRRRHTVDSIDPFSLQPLNVLPNRHHRSPITASSSLNPLVAAVTP
ncbi:unnamed protein product [Soboliphyme baturini]|uniref:Uncharacterized protein n=1 Tax=Soboliphyme baturini TaxID=241478 RepID=A0A183IV96_9BILA|nr:unnamed protein product [Soboliphyme baturini]